MDFQIELKFQELVKKLELKFGPGLDIESVVLLIGVQELGKGHMEFTKDEKINLMHIAICTVLEPYGFYKFKEIDKDGWPHFHKVKNIPFISEKEKEHLMKEAILSYFEVNELL